MLFKNRNNKSNWLSRQSELGRIHFNDGGGEGGGNNGGGEGDGGGDDNANAIDPNQFKSMQDELERLKGHHQKLLDETKSAKSKAKALEEERAKEAQEFARKNGDIEALEKSWEEKYNGKIEELTGQFQPKVQELEGLLRNATVTSVATQIAADLAVKGSAKALMPHIEKRLTMDIRDGKAVTVVTDANGKPSALTLEELKNEFIGDSAFAPLIVGSKASGGGASGGDGPVGKTLKRADFENKSPVERADFMKSGGKIID